MPAYAEGGDGNSNPFAFAITIGAHDSVSIPPSSLLSSESSRLCQLEEESLGMWEDIAVFTDAQETISLDSISTSSETTSSDVECLGVALCDISRLSFGPCTSAVVPPEYQSTFIRDIVTYSLWIRDQASPSSSALPRRVLIHCQDGYTDSSLLALTYLMVSRRINAAQAYLVLQMECGRSFHVYNADVQLIRRIEKRVKTELEREERDGREGGSLSEGMARSDSGFVEGQVQTTGEMRSKEQREELKLSNPVDDAWFYAPTWEGVFPSRITPFLVRAYAFYPLTAR
jgi:dual specificity MAP kinase phosphatase